MEYDIEGSNTSFKLRMHIPTGLGNQAKATLACSKDDRFKLVIPKGMMMHFYVETYPSGILDVESTIKEFESRYALAGEQLIKANALHEALQLWRKYLGKE